MSSSKSCDTKRSMILAKFVTFETGVHQIAAGDILQFESGNHDKFFMF
ncbi:MAG: hypothetical protein M3275_09140 [Thermoproteota archaeon]|nr:hypothetical protein [Thermoproteota archaeon]